MSDDPQSTKSWDVGAVGEERVGTRLNELASESLRVLHDRRIPGSKANIDHIAVAATGVFVIDPKRYKGRPSLKVEGGLLRPRVERPLIGGSFTTRDVEALWPRKLYPKLQAVGPLTVDAIADLQRRLAAGLPAA